LAVDSLPFLAALFLSAFSSLLGHALYPPLRVGLTARSTHRIAASLPPGTPTVRLPALVASLLSPALRGAFADKKIGGVQVALSPPRPVGGLALLPALFLAALRSLFRH
jgi:hypothetical protein